MDLEKELVETIRKRVSEKDKEKRYDSVRKNLRKIPNRIPSKKIPTNEVRDHKKISQIIDNLNRLENLYDIQIKSNVETNRSKIISPIVLRVRKILQNEIRFTIDPIIDKQVSYNSEVLQTLQTLIQTLDGKSKNQEALIQTLNNQSKSQESLIQTLDGKSKNQEALIQTLDGKSKNQEALIQTLNNQSKSQETLIQKLSETEKTQESLIFTLNKNLERVNDRLSGLLEASEKTQEIISHLSLITENHQKSISKLSTTVNKPD